MTILKSILFTIIFILFTSIITLWAFLIPYEEGNINLVKNGHFFNSIITLSVLIIYFSKIRDKNLLKLNSTHYKYYLIAIVIGLLFPQIKLILNSIYFQQIPTDIWNNQIGRLKSLSIIASIFIVPIIEELFFRNFIQQNLNKKYNIYISIIFTSILFASIHIPFLSFFFEFWEFSLHQTYLALFGGFFTGILFYKSKSIGPPIILHMVWNIMANLL